MMMWRLISHGTTPGDAHGLLMAWSGWEQLSHRLWPTTEIPAAPFRLLELRIISYRGAPFILADGTRIDEHNLLCELHCNNRNILSLVMRTDLNPFAAAREDLRSLAIWAQEDDIGRRIRALYGVTMLTQGAARLGFTIRPQAISIRRRFEKIFMTGLLLLYAPDGVRRLMCGTTPSTYPQEVWMSRQELINRYGNRSARVLEPGADQIERAEGGCA